MHTLVEKYLQFAEQWGEEMEEGNSSKANAIHDKIQAIYREIIAANEDASLFQYVDDDRDVIRFFIASHLKEKNALQAIELYKKLELSALPYLAISSRYILRELQI